MPPGRLALRKKSCLAPGRPALRKKIMPRLQPAGPASPEARHDRFREKSCQHDFSREALSPVCHFHIEALKKCPAHKERAEAEPFRQHTPLLDEVAADATADLHQSPQADAKGARRGVLPRGLLPRGLLPRGLLPRGLWLVVVHRASPVLDAVAPHGGDFVPPAVRAGHPLHIVINCGHCFVN